MYVCIYLYVVYKCICIHYNLSYNYACWSFSATEIQNIQIADGDVCRGLPIPIFMIFPRLFTCPTLSTSNFKVGQYLSLLRTITCFI